MIVKKNEEGLYDNLIAQSKNGSGKTGTYVIGSLLRLDLAVKKPQVLVLAHTRELANQITGVYEGAAKYMNVKIQNIVDLKQKPDG